MRVSAIYMRVPGYVQASIAQLQRLGDQVTEHLCQRWGEATSVWRVNDPQGPRAPYSGGRFALDDEGFMRGTLDVTSHDKKFAVCLAVWADVDERRATGPWFGKFDAGESYMLVEARARLLDDLARAHE